jgi:glycosyltransferase involved in cell wall biosynthesis
VIVAPSRGEGFGLPIAEALALGKPVITTAFGGQIEFCSAENSWLCDYDFGYAKSHISSPLSVWAEPKTQSLVDCLKAAYNSSSDERGRRGSIGSAVVRAGFSWNAVAARLQEAKAAANRMDVRIIQLPTVAWVSTWNNRCGIADYSQSLTCAFPEGRLKVFANWNAEQQLGPDLSVVKRCWEQSWRDPLDVLFQEIDATRCDAVVLQFNFGFYDIGAFRRLVERLIDSGRQVYVTLHSTIDIEREDLTIRLSDALPALKRARRVFVHSVQDMNRLKSLGLINNVSIQPFGMPELARADAKPLQSSRPLIATFGYLLPHKGILELIEAVSILRAQNFDVELLLLNAIYPAKESEHLKQACEEAIARHGIADLVELRTDFLPSEEVVRILGAADLIVYPYQNTHESASAAVRMGLASRRPVVTSPVAIFSDIASISHVLPGFMPSEIALGVRQLLEERSELERYSAAQDEWVGSHQWPQVSRRLYDLMRGELISPLDFRNQWSYRSSEINSLRPKVSQNA